MRAAIVLPKLYALPVDIHGYYSITMLRESTTDGNVIASRDKAGITTTRKFTVLLTSSTRTAR